MRTKFRFHQIGVAILATPLFLAAQQVPQPPPLPALALPPPPPDIRGIVPAQPYHLPANYLLIAALIAGLLLAGWAIWHFFLRPRWRRPPRRPTPREVAVARLLELERQLDALPPRVFGGEVCDVLRAYIGAQFGLHPERQTSPEFLASIANASVFSDAEKTLLTEFLEQCDLLKFARLDATREAKKRLLTQANEFLRPVPVVPQTVAAGA